MSDGSWVDDPTSPEYLRWKKLLDDYFPKPKPRREPISQSERLFRYYTQPHWIDLDEKARQEAERNKSRPTETCGEYM